MAERLSGIDAHALKERLLGLGRPAAALRAELGRPPAERQVAAAKKLEGELMAVGRPVAALSAPVDFLNALRNAVAAPVASVRIRSLT